MAQDDKKVYPSRSISQEPDTIWLSFMACMCRLIISPGVFSFFQDFDFLSCYRGKWAKNSPKWQKILSITLNISGTMHYMILIYVTHV